MQLKNNKGLAKVKMVGVIPPSKFCSLSFVQQFVVWSVRMWLASFCKEAGSQEKIKEAYAILGITSAVSFFDRGMSTFVGGTDQNVLFLGVKSDYVSIDENQFLKMVAGFQSQNDDQAHQVLCQWLPKSGVRIASLSFNKYSNLIKDGGLVLPKIIYPSSNHLIDNNFSTQIH